jgi:thymidylate synthase
MISLIACVANVENKLCIGKNNELLFKLKNDMAFFKNITTNSLTKDSKLKWNVVLMGRKTYYSIPSNFRPLKNRFNFILTNDPKLLTRATMSLNEKQKINFDSPGPYFMNMDTFKKIYKKYTPNVFVIGGSQVYNHFLKESDVLFKPEKLYVTEVKGYKGEIGCNYAFMNNFDYKYNLVGYSEASKENDLSYRTLYYNLNPTSYSEEFRYLNLAKHILEKGKERVDRTGVGTISTFGPQLRFDISNSILPLLTTKRVGLKAIVEELLFFCRGDTDAKILDRKGVKIWNDNTSRNFLDNRGLGHYSQGIMGPMYGWSWRNFGANYSQTFSDTSKIDTNIAFTGFDQLSHVENLLKTDPFSRRIYISNLNPAESKNMCLDMCHTYIQFYVEEIDGEKFLSGYFTMRSSDSLAWCYNICSYSILVNILALRSGMKPKDIVYNSVDCHIYKNHIEGIKTQLLRTPRPFPKIKLNAALKHKDWSEMKFSDFELIGYFPHASIKMDMAI